MPVPKGYRWPEEWRLKRVRDPVARLAEKSIPEPNSGCTLWMGGQNGSGYGLLSVNGEFVYAHRFAYELACGPIPDGVFVCHHCDNPPCVNPDHLFLGTQLDNQRDCHAKERDGAAQHPELFRRLGRRLGHSRKGVKMGFNPACVRRGEDHGKAKLTTANVLAIRDDTRRNPEIAASYGVTPNMISQIKRRKAWRHV